MDKKLMDLCDEFLKARVEAQGMPHDFDDVTWVMHDFVLWMRERAAPETPVVLTRETHCPHGIPWGAECLGCNTKIPV